MIIILLFIVQALAVPLSELSVDCRGLNCFQEEVGLTHETKLVYYLIKTFSGNEVMQHISMTRAKRFPH